jgi:DNA-binding response OmpR family regulator
VTEPVDVLVLDLRLPVLHGLDVYMELKRRGRELPTILVTAYRTEEAKSIDALRSMSVTGCLFKPFEPAELLNAIDEVKAEKCR